MFCSWKEPFNVYQLKGPNDPTQALSNISETKTILNCCDSFKTVRCQKLMSFGVAVKRRSHLLLHYK